MGSLLSRSVEVEISNKTRNITLKNPRTYFNCGHCSTPPMPEVAPGSTDSCRLGGSFPFWGVAGVLAYEAESFTLAIHFSNPIDYNRFSIELGLEISLSKAHLGSLEDTYTRMAEGRSSRCPVTTLDRVILCRSHGTAQVSAGPVKVTATMSNTTSATLRVVLEDQEASGKEAGKENPCPGKHFQEARRASPGPARHFQEM